MAEKKPAASEWRNHWPLVAVATAGMSLAALSTSSTQLMFQPMEAEFGWSRAQISSGPSLIAFVILLCATMGGVLIDRLGPRRVGILASVLLCGTIAAMSQIGAHMWQWWALWLLIGLGSSVMPAVWLQPVTHGFAKGRGLALAIVLSGSGISSTLLPLIGSWLVETQGWRGAYLGLAALWAIIVLPLVILFLRSPGSAPGQVKTSDPAPAPQQLAGYAFKQGLRTATFWKLFAAHLLATGASVAMVLNLVPVLISTGLTLAGAAGVASTIGMATIAGRVMGGWAIDRFAAAPIAAACCAIMSVLPITLLAMPGSIPAAVAAVVVIGLSGGALSPGLAWLTGRHLGTRNFGTFYSTINTGSALAVGLAPLAANFVYDLTKSYTPVLWAVIPGFLLAGLCYVVLGPAPVFAEDG